MKVTIFGAGGYVGRKLVEAYRAGGDVVNAISSANGDFDPSTGLLSERVCLPAGTEVVYYLSQSPHYRQVPGQAPHLLSVNCVAAVQAARLAMDVGARRLVYASTGNVYAPTFEPIAESAAVRRDSWYSLSKLMGEDALALFRDRMEISVLRIFGIYGPGQQDKLIPSLVDSVRTGRKVIADRHPFDGGDAGGLRISPVFIEDAVSMMVDLTAKPVVPLLNLAGDRVLSVAEISRIIAQKLGTSVQVELADRTRQMDLIADIKLLRTLLSPRFTDFESGLDEVLKA